MLLERVINYEKFGKYFYFVFSIFTYQIAIGCSVRVWDNRPHVRIYFGPFKIAAGLRNRTDVLVTVKLEGKEISDAVGIRHLREVSSD